VFNTVAKQPTEFSYKKYKSGSTGSRVLQVLWFYRFQGSIGSRVLLVLRFYRFCGSTDSRVLQVLWFYRF